MRPAGVRSIPWTPRRTTAPAAPPRAAPPAVTGIHGRGRARSWLSWRRSSTTVRRSCIVTANRSCDTRPPRRARCSDRSRPTTRWATASSTATATTDSRSVDSLVTSRSAIRPSPSAGPVRSSSAAQTCQPTSAPPAGVASQLGMRAACTMVAAATKRAPTAAPSTAPHHTHAPALDGTRCSASSPATPPASAPPNATARTRCHIGRRNTAARLTGASRRCCTSADSTVTGPPSAPLRSPAASAAMATAPRKAGPLASTSAMRSADSSASPTWSLRTMIAEPPKKAARYTR